MSRLFQRPPLPISTPYLIGGTIAITLIVLAQTAATVDGRWTFYISRISIFTLNYAIWAILAANVYAATFYYQPEKNALAETLLLITHALLWSFVNLLLSNIIYLGAFYIYDSTQGQLALDSFGNIWLRAWTSRFIDFWVIFAIFRIIKGYKALSEHKMQVLDLGRELAAARLEVLKAQLNPHFLFNALHTVSSMIGNDDVKARKMLIRISDLLRKTLDQQTQQYVSFEEELNYIADYLEIEQMRFYDRLDIRYDIGSDVRSFKIPGMLLQPLIENAFKHAISQQEGNSWLSISAAMAGEGLNINVENSLTAKDKTPESRCGIGLDNLKSRLHNYYGDRFRMEITAVNDTFSVQLTLPPDGI